MTDKAGQSGTDFRAAVRAHYTVDESALVNQLIASIRADRKQREAIAAAGAKLVERVRNETSPSMMESFLAEYGLSTDEGVGLMCLAEALLRVPDAETIDDLIQDKIEPSDWGAHLGHSSSPLINASTWALLLTGKVLDDDPKKPAAALRRLIRRVGEPLVRTAVAQAMKLLGRQFVLGETIDEGMHNARELEDQGYTYSYDMLGEAARTDADAIRYHAAYAKAIAAIARRATGDVRSSPGISVKLSALHPRYEYTHQATVMTELLPRAVELAQQAAAASIGFNIDAEEQDRLDLSLDIIEALLAEPSLANWNGLGIVVQAYGKRAVPVIEALYGIAERQDRRIMVRLVKGAYWDTEVKLAQELGVASFPVFTRKVNTDVSYMACAQLLLDRRDRIYPQFATHNAHTCAAVLALAGDDLESFEFQRLHGMGESLHDIVRKTQQAHCRIYAPVGAHQDLLAYLVRRLLENGANSSFVNQVVDESIPPQEITRDPVAEVEALGDAIANPAIRLPMELFAPRRQNSKGYRVNEPASITPLLEAREQFADRIWRAAPMLAGDPEPQGEMRSVVSPAESGRIVVEVWEATGNEVELALDNALGGFEAWSGWPVDRRATVLREAARLYEENIAELAAIATREAGKMLLDGIAEVREAVDFLRYYANEAERLEDEEPGEPCGVFVCISPWNFPLAIFSGQIAAALAAGNAVIAKPAEQTPAIAARAVELMREAGLPKTALQLLPGDGPTVGGPLASDPRIAGVCFTGSTEVAQIIHRSLAENAGPEAVLIAETGGLNAMIVDSTALTEQAVRDILISSFQSAGQRCSALRILYVQEEGPRTVAGNALRRHGCTRHRRSLGPRNRRFTGDRRRCASRYQRLCQRARKSRQAVEETAGARTGLLRHPGGDRGGRHRRYGAGNLRSGTARSKLQIERHRPRGRRHQCARLRLDLRFAHAHRRPRAANRRTPARRQRLCQSQPDRRHRRFATLRRRRPVGHRSQGRRPALREPLPTPRGIPGAGGSRDRSGRRGQRTDRHRLCRRASLVGAPRSGFGAA